MAWHGPLLSLKFRTEVSGPYRRGHLPRAQLNSRTPNSGKRQNPVLQFWPAQMPKSELARALYIYKTKSCFIYNGLS